MRVTTLDAPLKPEQLGHFTLFRGLPPEALTVVARIFEAERFPAGTVIFREGDAGDKLFLIVEGTIRITQRLGDTGEEALAVLHAGDYFGDMALIDAHPRSADAVVEGEALTYTIRRHAFLTLLRTDAALTVNVLFRFIDTLVERLRVSNDRIRALNLMSMW